MQYVAVFHSQTRVHWGGRKSTLQNASQLGSVHSGPYFDRPWGPQPEMLARWRSLAFQGSSSELIGTMYASSMQWLEKHFAGQTKALSTFLGEELRLVLNTTP
eukprot:441600-Amphidinium_carterae.1